MRAEYFGPRSSPGQNAAVCNFVSRLVWGAPGLLSHGCSMGVFDGDELVAGTVYHNWEPEAGVIEMTSGSTTRRWLTRPVVRAMFALPFDILGLQMVVLRVSERNESMVRIAKSFGFDGVLIPRLRGRDEAEWIFTYTDDAWRSSRYHEAA